MRRETAYKLAGRHHEKTVPGTGLVKTRELRFKRIPSGQAEHAWRALRMLKDLHVERSVQELSLIVRYSVLDYSMEGIETGLREAGFVLDNSLYMKLVRALVYFTEETQRHNLLSPERLIKQSNEVYIQAWDKQAHGDHDDVPVELREYK